MAGAAPGRTCRVIQGWEVSHNDIVRPPKGTTHVVLDTPAGLHGKRLDAVLRIANKLLVPLQPSLFDIQATHAFLGALRAHPRAADIDVALVGMRVREHTLSNEQLHQYLATLNVPVVAWLRDTQNYVQLAARGLTLWDVAPSRVERDLEQWLPLKEWIRDETLCQAAGPAGPGRPGDRRQRMDHASIRSASTSSPRPPATTNGSTSTRSRRRRAPSARPSRTASSR